MIANAAWKPAKTSAGMVKVTFSGSIRPSRKAYWKGLPRNPPNESPNAME